MGLDYYWIYPYDNYQGTGERHEEVWMYNKPGNPYVSLDGHTSLYGRIVLDLVENGKGATICIRDEHDVLYSAKDLYESHILYEVCFSDFINYGIIH